jgi:hypothetical protein
MVGGRRRIIGDAYYSTYRSVVRMAVWQEEKKHKKKNTGRSEGAKKTELQTPNLKHIKNTSKKVIQKETIAP